MTRTERYTFDAGSPSQLCDRRTQTRMKALALFASRGFQQVSLRELGNHLGISAGSLYNHFESKETLLFELVEDLYEDLLEPVRSQSPTKLDQEARVREFISRHIALQRGKHDQFQLAELELRSLSVEHLAQIESLRGQYELRLLSLLSMPDTPIYKSAVRGLMPLLNSLLACKADTLLTDEQHLELATRMTLGVLAAARQTSKSMSAPVIAMKVARNV